LWIRESKVITHGSRQGVYRQSFFAATKGTIVTA